MMDLEAARREGYWTSRQTPYGFRRGGRYPRCVLEPDARAPVVRSVFMALAAGASRNEVVRRLRDAGAPSPSAAREGAPDGWSRYAVGAIVANPVYMGYVRDGERLMAARFDALVSEDLWDAANARARSEVVTRRQGEQKASAQRDAFEDGYWHHQKVPQGCVRSGAWPRYILSPSPDFPAIRDLLERIADGEDMVDVRMRAKEVFARRIGGWKVPSEAAAHAIKRYALNPVFAGYTAWTNGKGHRVEFRRARWEPFMEPSTVAEAYRRVRGREAPWLPEVNVP